MIQLPFYGGAKGSILRFVKNKNGSLTTQVSAVGSEESLDSVDQDDQGTTGFGDNLLKIQKAASKLVAIQQLVKASGMISDDEKKVYAENLDSLGEAAQALAKMNEGADEDDFRRLVSSECPIMTLYNQIIIISSCSR